MYCGDRRGCHSSLGCVICQKSHLCFIMYCGDRRGCHSSLGCHLSKITFMFCHVLWGQTGVSVLIRVCHLSKIIFMFYHVLWGQTGGGHSLLGSVICQKSHLCCIMYCGDIQGCHSSLGCHLSKITFMFCHVLWGQTGGSLLIRVCHLSKITFVHHNWCLCGFSSKCRQWHWWHAVTTRLGMTTYSNSYHHVDDMAPSVMRELHRITKPYNVTSSNQPRLVWTGGGTNPFNKIRRWKYSTFSVNGVINLTCVCTLVYLHHTVVLALTCGPGEAVT